MPTDSYEADRKARLNEEGKYLRIKGPRDIDWGTPLWEQLAPVLKEAQIQARHRINFVPCVHESQR